VCAALAASVAGEYDGGLTAQLGALRPVVVAAGEVPPGRPLSAARARGLLDVREVPERFAPADALTDPLQAIGAEPASVIPAGSYVTPAHLRAEGPRRGQPPAGDGGEAVEIAVAGAGALAAGAGASGRAYDVVATTEPEPGGRDGTTRVVAQGVRLLALDGGGSAELGAGPAAWTATVAATRSQALRLIHAHNYARELRLIAADGGGG
jgi:Flp pilus assembly protein CpaB